VERIAFDPPPAHDERLRAHTGLCELSRAVELGTLNDYGLRDARNRLKTCNEWPNLDPDLDAARIRLIDLVCRRIADGNADVLSYYAAQGDLIDHVPDDLSTLLEDTRPHPPPPPSYGAS
jgi:hypothetical protein